jgi:hypothetical protein
MKTEDWLLIFFAARCTMQSWAVKEEASRKTLDFYN